MHGETLLVVGASGGLGRAVALHLARLGAHVAVHYHQNRGAAQALVEEIKANGGKAAAVQADLRAAGWPDGVLDAAEEALGPITGLVYAAGVANPDMASYQALEDWDEVQALNVRGAVLACQAVVPGMVRRRRGAIVLIGSETGRYGSPGLSAYAASKAGLEAYGKSLAFELGARGVRVNVVSPGPIETEMVAELSPEARQALTERIALGRFGQPEEVAEVVAFLLGDAARYVTGVVVPVNGGLRTL